MCAGVGNTNIRVCVGEGGGGGGEGGSRLSVNMRREDEEERMMGEFGHFSCLLEVVQRDIELILFFITKVMQSINTVLL